MRTYLGRVFRDVSRKIAGNAALEAKFARLLGLVERLLAQRRTNSMPCMPPRWSASPKARRTPYEFGAKIGIAVTNREGLVLAAKAFAGNPYDGHTLAATLDRATSVSGVEPERIYVDKGYRGHNYTGAGEVMIAGRRRGLSATMRRELRRRSAIEAAIGH